MKKTISCLLAITLLLGLLAGCGKKNNAGEGAAAANIGAGEMIRGWADLNLFNKGLIAVADATGKWGFVNNKGEWKIMPQYDAARAFSDCGLAAVCVGEHWGFVTTEGTFAVNLNYEYVADFGANGIAVVRQNGKYGAINAEGKTIVAMQFDSMSNFDKNGLAKISYSSGTNDWGETERAYGYVNREGKIVVPAEYVSLGSFAKNGLAYCGKQVRNENGEYVVRYGYVNQEGQVVIAPQYDYVGMFADNGLAMVQLPGTYDEYGYQSEGRYAFIDAKGNYKVPGVYDEAGSFSGGLAQVAVMDNDGYRWGYVDETGKEVIPLQYREARPFGENGLAAVCIDGKWGYIDKTGSLKIAAQYAYAASFGNGDYAVVGVGEDYHNFRYGVINNKGELVVSTIYESISTVGDGMIVVELDGKYGALDSTGKEVVPIMYDALLGFFKDNYAIIEMGANYGIIDKQGQMVINPQFSEIAEPWIDWMRLAV